MKENDATVRQKDKQNLQCQNGTQSYHQPEGGASAAAQEGRSTTTTTAAAILDITISLDTVVVGWRTAVVVVNDDAAPQGSGATVAAILNITMCPHVIVVGWRTVVVVVNDDAAPRGSGSL